MKVKALTNMKISNISEKVSMLAVALLTTAVAQSQQLYKSLDNAHNEQILSVAVNNDGSRILTGGGDKRAYLWDAQSGDKLKILSHSAPVTGVAFNTSGKYFATASGTRILVFDAKEAKPLKMLREHSNNITCIAYNPINDELASGSEGNNIRLWDGVEGTFKRILQGHSAKINTLSYSPDGKWLASGSDDGNITIWEASSGMVKNTINTEQKAVTAVSFSADGRYLASGGKNGSVVLWDVASGGKSSEFNDLKGTVGSVIFSPDVQYLIAGGEKGKIIVWNLETKQVHNEMNAHADKISAIAISDKGQLFSSVGNDGAVKIWHTGSMNIGKKKSVQQEEKPELTTSPLTLTESNNNGIIEPGERPVLSFVIENEGKGKAYDVVAKLSLNENVTGLNFEKEFYVGNLDRNSKQKIELPLFPQQNLETTSGTFIASVEEANGNNPSPVKISFQTRGAEHYSYVMFTHHEFSSATGKAEVGAPITLKLKLQNTSEGDAKDLKVNYILPKNVLAVDKLSESIEHLAPGETKELSVQFYANEKYKEEKLKILIDVQGAAYTNTSELDLKLDMNEKLPVPASVQTIADNASSSEEPLYRGGGDPLKGLNVSKSKQIVIGNYYALIIGIDKYSGHWTPLRNAVRDAKAIETVLKNKYKFDRFKTLYDEDASRGNIIKEMEWLVQNVKPNDNVFIYYSGHGEFKEALNKGFWVPANAATASTSEYISNSDIQTFLGGIRSKHTLLVSDACFSGDIFRGNTVMVPFEDSEKYYREIHSLMSRKAITSGGIEPVMDGGRDGHSVFAYYLLKTLENNEKKYLDAGQLYEKIKIPVINNSEQTPNFSPVKNAGDEGGQFIFIKK